MRRLALVHDTSSGAVSNRGNHLRCAALLWVDRLAVVEEEGPGVVVVLCFFTATAFQHECVRLGDNAEGVLWVAALAAVDEIFILAH